MSTPQPTNYEPRNLAIGPAKTLYANRLLPTTPGRIMKIESSAGIDFVGGLYVDGVPFELNGINTPDNLALGVEALAELTTGLYNVAIGPYALASGVTMLRCTAVGRLALAYNMAGSNTAIGDSAMSNNVTGTANVAIGTGAMLGAVGSSGSGNTAIGVSSLTGITTGSENTAIGQSAGRIVSTGGKNVFIGNSAGFNTTTGSRNTIIGNDAFRTNVVGSNCTVIGYGAAPFTTIDDIVAVGSQALANHTTGIACTAVGRLALSSSVISANSTAVGYSALISADSNDNTGIGAYSLETVTTGTSNTALGYNSQADAAAIERVAIGANAQAIADYDVQLGQRESRPSGALYYRLQQVSNATWNDTFSGLASIDSTGNIQKTRQLAPGVERFSLDNNQAQSPDVAVATTFVTTTGVGVGTPAGTLANGTTDGQIKQIVLSVRNANYALTVTNGLQSSGIALNSLTFTTAGQSAQLIWDATAGKWLLLSNTAVAV